MNCKEHHLPELEISTGQVRSALQCILHTILFLRSPGPVTPRDVECDDFQITYARIANNHNNNNNQTNNNNNTNHQNNSHPTGRPNSNVVNTSLENDIEQKVDDAIESFLRSLTQIGPELLSGCLTVSFFERRATRQLFGLVSHEERVVFEQWVLRVVVNNTPRPISNDSAAVIERQRLQDTAEGMLKSALVKIFEITGGPIDHLPPVMYEFDISCSKRVDERENVYSRVANMPPILNLTN